MGRELKGCEMAGSGKFQTAQSAEGHDRAAAALRVLGHVIKDRRVELGLSQEELASGSDLHRTYISHLERSERNIAFMNLCRIAWALELTCSELVDRCEP